MSGKKKEEEPWRTQLCWKCGKKLAVALCYGFPVCEDCNSPNLDPESLEDVVIESLKKGKIVPKSEVMKSSEDAK